MAARRIESRTQSMKDARKRLAEKRVAPAYRPPRANQELDRALTDHAVDRLNLIVR